MRDCILICSLQYQFLEFLYDTLKLNDNNYLLLVFNIYENVW